MESDGKTHLLAVPFSVAGHVKPLMNFCYRVAAEGIRVTFVTTEAIHARIIAENEEDFGKLLTFASVPDGLESAADRGDSVKLQESMRRVMPGHLMELVKKINLSENGEPPITAVITDATIGWTLDVAEKIAAQQFAFWLAAPGGLAFLSNVPELNIGAFINKNGRIAEDAQINGQSSSELREQQVMADMARETQRTVSRVKSILCNTFYDLDPSSCKVVPKMLPVGPLKSLSTSRRKFLEPEHSLSCMEWLDRQQNNSVIYVAFGGTGILSQQQFNELALGLELAGRPFLWVVRSNFIDGSSISYPNGYLGRVADNGKIVDWAPQEKVLAHPATACFLSHCGWNSIMEGISFGVPFLCWPYFGDQFFNRDYICNGLKVGLKLDEDENGVKSKEEISNKIEMLLSNVEIKANASKLKNLGERCISKEGSSYQNLQSFINQLRS